MSGYPAICYVCNQTFLTSTRVDGQPPRCPYCNSEFVEILSEEPRFERHRQTRFQWRPEGGHPNELTEFMFPDSNVSIRLATSRADEFMREISSMLEMEPLGRGQRGPFRRHFGSEMERLVGQLAQVHQTTRSPVSNEALEGLRREKLKPNASLIGECCVVCHDAYKEGDTVVHLPCDHAFHEDCVLPWFEEHNTCPVCRHALPVENASTPRQRRSRRRMGDANMRDLAPEDHMIDSLWGLFRPGESSRLRHRPANEMTEDRYIRDSVRLAQQQYHSLEDHMAEHLNSHRQLQDQLMHETRTASAESDESPSGRRNSPFMRLFGMMRHSPGRSRSHDFGNARFSDAR